MDPSRIQEIAQQTRQNTQTSESEATLRAQQEFPDVEHLLPKLVSKYSHSFVDSLASYLGRYNPLTHTANTETDLVWIFDNAAYLSKSSAKSWQAKYVIAYFAKESGANITAAAGDIARILQFAKGDKTEAIIEQRLTPFFHSILPSRVAEITISSDDGEPQVVKVGPSGPNGISVNGIDLRGAHHDSQMLKVSIPGPVTDLQGRTRVVHPEGWAVISDIDDTIKKTLTSDPIGILRTTFVEEPEAIPGMPALYQYIDEKLQRPPFWYLSASPYNLYPFLRNFRDTAGYPTGTIILREASWMNLGGFLGSLTKGTLAYKTDRMRTEIHAYWPHRKFICIGDTTQSDPEAYAEMYRKHPGWIRAIFIRKALGVVEVGDLASPGGDEQRNSAERFEKAFKDVPANVWHVFEDPAELYARVDALVSTDT